MEKEKAIKITSIIIGLIVSVLVLWFGFKIVQQRFGRASANITNVICEPQSSTSYEVSFDSGASKEAYVQYGLTPDSLASISPADCAGAQCTAPITLVPEGATVYYKIAADGQQVGNGAPGDEAAPPFVCSGAETETTQSVDQSEPEPTEAKTPTPTVDACQQIKNKYSKWTATCLEEFKAIDCARCLSKDVSADSN